MASRACERDGKGANVSTSDDDYDEGWLRKFYERQKCVEELDDPAEAAEYYEECDREEERHKAAAEARRKRQREKEIRWKVKRDTTRQRRKARRKVEFEREKEQPGRHVRLGTKQGETCKFGQSCRFGVQCRGVHTDAEGKFFQARDMLNRMVVKASCRYCEANVCRYGDKCFLFSGRDGQCLDANDAGSVLAGLRCIYGMEVVETRCVECSDTEETEGGEWGTAMEQDAGDESQSSAEDSGYEEKSGDEEQWLREKGEIRKQKRKVVAKKKSHGALRGYTAEAEADAVLQEEIRQQEQRRLEQAKQNALRNVLRMVEEGEQGVLPSYVEGSTAGSGCVP